MIPAAVTSFEEVQQKIRESLKDLPRKPAKRVPSRPQVQPRPISQARKG